MSKLNTLSSCNTTEELIVGVRMHSPQAILDVQNLYRRGATLILRRRVPADTVDLMVQSVLENFVAEIQADHTITSANIAARLRQSISHVPSVPPTTQDTVVDEGMVEDLRGLGKKTIDALRRFYCSTESESSIAGRLGMTIPGFRMLRRGMRDAHLNRRARCNAA